MIRLVLALKKWPCRLIQVLISIQIQLPSTDESLIFMSIILSGVSNAIPKVQNNYLIYTHQINLQLNLISTIYNMSGCVVSDIQTRAEGESLYIRYNTEANVVNGLKNDSSYEFIGEVILKINVV